ncbi:TRADD-N-associated membrane domain-containing protein [Micromonospora sp. L32]|uniref:TRADD-N-associated membrane domain-containing protein n=1 Tax=Micromonospora sp. L32 TaxID=3452214 RepID=UPI003F8C39A2
MTQRDVASPQAGQPALGLMVLLIPTLGRLSSSELQAALWEPAKRILDSGVGTRSSPGQGELSPDSRKLPQAEAEPHGRLTALLESVRGGLTEGDERALSKQIVTSAEGIAENIRTERIRQARASFNAALSLAIVGVLLVFAGVGLVLTDVVTAGVLASIASAVTESAALLLFRLNKQANDRLDRVNADLARLSRFRLTMNLVDSISDARSRDRAVAQALRSLNSP